jgi:hypothetical protein
MREEIKHSRNRRASRPRMVQCELFPDAGAALPPKVRRGRKRDPGYSSDFRLIRICPHFCDCDRCLNGRGP